MISSERSIEKSQSVSSINESESDPDELRSLLHTTPTVAILTQLHCTQSAHSQLSFQGKKQMMFGKLIIVSTVLITISKEMTHKIKIIKRTRSNIG